MKFTSSGLLDSWTGSPILLDSSFPKDPEVEEELKPYQAKLEQMDRDHQDQIQLEQMDRDLQAQIQEQEDMDTTPAPAEAAAVIKEEACQDDFQEQDEMTNTGNVDPPGPCQILQERQQPARGL